MSHEFLDTNKLALPAPAAGLGEWQNVLVPDDGDERKAAVLGIGIEALAQRTTWLRHRTVITEPFGVSIPSITNSGATVGASNSFVVKKALTINTAAPNGGAGYVAPVFWVTPTVPFEINRAYIRLSGSLTASIAPVFVTLDLFLGPRKLVTGTMTVFLSGILPAPAVVVPINSSTANKSIFGIEPGDRGELLNGTMAASSQDYMGAAVVAGALVCHTNFASTSFFGKQITLRLTHGGGAPITFTMPLEVVLAGRLL